MGVLVETDDGYLFVEKISFDEPYQAFKFNTKEEAYNYLYEKFEDFHDETTAKPFIMENDVFIEI